MQKTYGMCSKEQIEEIESGEWIKNQDAKEFYKKKIEKFKDFCEKELNLQKDIDSKFEISNFGIYADTRNTLYLVYTNKLSDNVIRVLMNFTLIDDKDAYFKAEYILSITSQYGKQIYRDQSHSLEGIKRRLTEWVDSSEKVD